MRLIAKYKFPVHIITKSTLVERDLDLLQQINQTAILPPDLKIDKGTIISFSFSTIDDNIGKIFEQGAPFPSQRLQVLDKCIREGFLTGVSLMPLMPFISDTTAHLHKMFSTFKNLNVHYLMPATITLFGEGKADSKTLMLDAIRKHYPELETRYIGYFNSGSEMPAYYQQAFYKKMQELLAEYNIPGTILKAAAQLK